MGFNSAFKGLKLLKKPGNGRLNNLNVPVRNVLRVLDLFILLAPNQVAKLQGLIWNFESVCIKSRNLNFIDFHKNKKNGTLLYPSTEF